MRNAVKAPLRSGAIVVLQGDESEGSAGALPQAAEAAFASRPFVLAARSVVSSQGSRLLDDAEDFGLCRSRRLLLEEQLALQEEFRLVDAERAAAIRRQLAQIEKHVGELPVDRLLAGFSAVQDQLYDESEERECW